MLATSAGYQKAQTWRTASVKSVAAIYSMLLVIRTDVINSIKQVLVMCLACSEFHFEHEPLQP